MGSKKIKYLVAGFSSFLIAMMTTSLITSAATYTFTQSGRNVHYNWGYGSPAGIPVDQFSAIIDQSGNYTAGDYFIQTMADDGVKVEVDGSWPIDRWSNSGGAIDRAIWPNVSAGQHTVKTHYYEDGSLAALFTDVVPFNSWLAYYYPNKQLSGLPANANVINPIGEFGNLKESFSKSSQPPTGVKLEDFSARYTTAKRIQAGEYVIRARADDGIRVYVDGKLVVDRWSNSSFTEDAVKIQISDRENVPENERNIHWIDVEYYNGADIGEIEFFIEPFQTAIDNSWVAEYYPNTTLSGNPVVIGGKNSLTSIKDLNFDWGNGSPNLKIPSEGFSARYTKKVRFEEGMYLFSASSDDGIRIWVDDQKIIDSWTNGQGHRGQVKLSLAEGEHTIKVEYYDASDLANISVNYNKFANWSTQGRNVHYNWGAGSPNGMPADFFTVDVDQSGNYTAGDYFIQTMADDGVKVEVDGSWPIDRWSNSGGAIDRAIWPNVSAGQHTVKTHYYEDGSLAALFTDVVPFNSWLAYYYPNKQLSGLPANANVINPIGEFGNLKESFSKSSQPPTGVKLEDFSARYTTAKRIQAGEYVIRARADDGIRVYVDGKLVVDRWSNSSFTEDAVKIQISDRENVPENERNIHWIDVEYYNGADIGEIEFFIEPFQTAIDNSWVAEYYPNTTLSGNPVVIGGKNSLTSIKDLNFDWGNGSPNSKIPSDNFSTRFTKKLSVNQGTYLFSVKADDGVRVWVDNQLLIDNWKNVDVYETKSNAIFLNSGEHIIKVEHYEGGSTAFLSLNYQLLSQNNIFYSISDQVQFNWGEGSPNNLPIDGFEAVFDQSQFLSGDYFIQTLADDRVKVTVDEKEMISKWYDSPPQINQALLLNLQPKKYKIITNYYETTGNAAIYSHIVPFDTWVAYYYNNKNLSGNPVASKLINPSGNYKALIENNGVGSPIQGNVFNDNFSAVYRTVKRVNPGEYVLRVKADDGIRVYLDGNPVPIIDSWTIGSSEETAVKINIENRSTSNPEEKNIHSLEVQYVEETGNSDVKVELIPYNEILNTDQWVGYLYPNTGLSGTPIIVGGVGAHNPITDINFNWGYGSPHHKVPNDNFSARYVKKAYFSEGSYQIKTVSDDGIRVYVDGNPIINSWVNSGADYIEETVLLSEGTHEIIVEYYDATDLAELKVDIIKASNVNSMYVSAPVLPVYRSFEELADYRQHLIYYNPSYTRFFELNYGDLVTIVATNQYAAKIKTSDGRVGWVHLDYLDRNLIDDTWLVKEGRNFRSGPSNSSSSIGFVPAGSIVYVLDYIKTADPIFSEWYYIQTQSGQRGWIWGAIAGGAQNSGRNIIRYESSKNGAVTNNITPFTPLTSKSNVTVQQIDSFINYKTGGKGIMVGMGYAYLEAERQSGLNAVYLLAHSALETGWGTSGISKTKYNYYGIGAIDSQPAQGAYTFDSREGGIIAGAIWISDNYIIRSWDKDDKVPFYQPTLDNMRNDNSWHQYSTDEAWAVKIANIIREFNNFLGN